MSWKLTSNDLLDLTMPYLNLNGEKIYYALHRNHVAGVPVVLIHGAGETHLIWPAGLRRLPATVVYALDLPGHGKSSGSGHGAIEEYAACLAAFQRALSLPRVILIGHSMGGAIAQLCGLLYPAETLGLGLLATSAKLQVSPQLLELAANNFPAAAELVSQWAWGPSVPDTIKRLGRQQLLATAPQVLLDDYRACHAFDLRERLSDLIVPSLVIAGEADRMTPLKHMTYLAEHLPHARLVTIPQAGHMVMIEAEAQVSHALTGFIAEVRRSA